MGEIKVENLVTLSEGAKLLKVSRPTIYALVKRGKLHPVAIGRNRYLLIDEIERIKGG